MNDRIEEIKNDIYILNECVMATWDKGVKDTLNRAADRLQDDLDVLCEQPDDN